MLDQRGLDQTVAEPAARCAPHPIHPLHFFEHEGGPYLFVLVPKYEDASVLAVERIQDLKMTSREVTTQHSQFSAGLSRFGPAGTPSAPGTYFSLHPLRI